MLLSIGPIVFDLINNVTSYEFSADEDFARKDVIGARRPLEATGVGTETMTFAGVLFPGKLGGSSTITALKLMKELAFPQLIIRGDGLIFGFFVVTSISGTGEFLNHSGQPRRVEFSVTCERSSQPSAGQVFQSLVSLFG